MKLLLCIAAALAASAPTDAQAQDLSMPGPLTPGWRDISFTLPGGAVHTGRVYYPALSEEEGAEPDLSAGPYPLASFCHGSLSHPGDFDRLSNHIVSHGWVLVSVPGQIENANIAAGRASKLLQWADEQNATDGSFLQGMVSGEYEWASIGHSMGGVSLQYLAGKEPKVRVFIGLAPGFDPISQTPEFATFDGRLLVVAGTADVTTPTQSVTKPYFKAAVAAKRKHFVEVEGGGHYEASDQDADIQFGPALPHNQGHRWIRRFVTAFLMAEVLGREEAYGNLMGDGADTGPQAVERLSKGLEPVVWASHSLVEPFAMNAGVTGDKEELGFLLASTEPGPWSSPLGELGVGPNPLFFLIRDSLGTEGWRQTTLAVPRRFAKSTLYLQGVVIGEREAKLTAPIEFVGPAAR